MVEKTTFAAMIAGIAARVGSHESRHEGMRRKAKASSSEQRAGTETPEHVGAQRAPEPKGERHDQETRQVCADLVVEPRAVRRRRAEVGDVVVGGAERGGLREAAGDPADVDRHEGEETADAGQSNRHAPTLARRSRCLT